MRNLDCVKSVEYVEVIYANDVTAGVNWTGPIIEWGNKMEISANQRLVNEAWEHLSSTRKKSVEEGSMNSCTYDGSGCAFSVCIKPEFVHLDILKGKSCLAFRAADNADKDGEARSAMLKDWALDVDIEFALGVQQAHDDCISSGGDEFVREFAYRLENAIHHYSLEVPESMTKWLADHEEVQ